MKNDIYDIYKIFKEGFQCGYYQRVGDNRLISLYIGKDCNGRYSFEYRGSYKPIRINSSDVIIVTQTKSKDDYCLSFSLDKPELLEYFCTFCQDLIDSCAPVTDDTTAYKMLYSRFMSWKKLFKPNNGNMTEMEIMGLLGELMFLRDYMIPKYDVQEALDSWMGPEKTHKDFSTDDIWFEIKTINSGKESVKISSIEQLDSSVSGYLVVFALEKMSPSYDGLTLNTIVDGILSKMTSHIQKDLFISKLELYGYDFSPDYNNYVYSLTMETIYLVDESFPRLKRDQVPISITKVQYELALSEIENKIVTP